MGVLVLVGGSVLWAVCDQWLPALFRFLDVGEAPRRAGAAVALGTSDRRTLTAISLLEQGMVGQVVVSTCETHVQAQTDLLAQQQVPPEASAIISPVTNTLEEAREVRAYLEARQVASVVVVTDAFHLRRARATWQHVLQDSGITLHVTAAEGTRAETNWWRSPALRRSVLLEYVKLLVYGFRYGIWAL